MSDPVTSLVVATPVAIGAGVSWLAVLDPSITNIALAVIALASAALPIWFKFKTDSLAMKLSEAEKKLAAHDVKIVEVEKATNGVTAALVKVTGEAKLAEGIVIGGAQANLVTAAKEEGRSAGVLQEQAAEEKRKMTP